MFSGGLSIRSKKYIMNVSALFIFRILNQLIALMIVPLSLKYLGESKYGAWLVMSSVTSYISLFDVGFGSGLRTKFAESIAIGNKREAQIYVSTTYGVVFIISILVIAISTLATLFADWSSILNIGPTISDNVDVIMLILFSAFSFRFVFQLISSINSADQRPAIADLMIALINGVNITSILILTYTDSKSILYYAIPISISPLIIYFTASKYFFSGRYKDYAPSIKYFKLDYIPSLISLNIKYFILRINVLILLTTDNIIISRLYDPSQVTPYYIAHRYFNFILLLFTSVTHPLWSAFTESFTQNDFNWIKRAVNRILLIWIVFTLISYIAFLLSPYAFRLWIGGQVIIPEILSVGMLVFILVSALNSPFASFNNGIGKIKVKTYVAILTAVSNIPLSILLARSYGSVGVIYATSICSFTVLMVNAYQYFIIVYRNKINSIWNK